VVVEVISIKSEKYFTEYQKIIKKNPEYYLKDYLKIKVNVKNSTAIYHGQPIDFLYQPMFFDTKDIKKLKKVSLQLILILEKVIKHYKNDPEFRSYFSFPEIMEKLILIDPGYEVSFPVARFDVFYDDDKLKFCEFNTDGASAMNECRVLKNVFQKSKIIKEMKNKYEIKSFELFYSLIKSIIADYNRYRQSFNQKTREIPHIAILDFEGEGTKYEFIEFKKRFIEMGYETIICDPRDLKYKNQRLYHKSFEKLLLLELFQLAKQ
jgi:glutathionylspermidine synthase